MRTPDEIRAAVFTKTPMGGYKQSEVDEFVDEMAAQVENLALKLKDYDAKIRDLEGRVSDTNVSQSGIQRILVAAQKVADDVEKEARGEADKIIAEATAKAKESLDKYETALQTVREKIEEEKKAADTEVEGLIAGAQKRAEEMIRAAKQSVAEEQKHYDALCSDAAALRRSITAQLTEFALLLKQLPEEGPTPTVAAEEAADAVLCEPVETPVEEESAGMPVEEEPIIPVKPSEPTVAAEETEPADADENQD